MPPSMLPMEQEEKARITTATVDDELAADPKLAQAIDEEVAQNHFLVRNA